MQVQSSVAELARKPKSDRVPNPRCRAFEGSLDPVVRTEHIIVPIGLCTWESWRVCRLGIVVGQREKSLQLVKRITQIEIGFDELDDRIVWRIFSLAVFCSRDPQ